MPSPFRLAPLALASLVLAGCGGGGLGGSNPFEGSYSGTYVSTTDATNTGAVSLQITSRGIVTGTLQGDDLRAQIIRDGTLTGVLRPTSGTIPVSGTLQTTTGDGLTGTIRETQGGASTTLTLTLSPIVTR